MAEPLEENNCDPKSAPRRILNRTPPLGHSSCAGAARATPRAPRMSPNPDAGPPEAKVLGLASAMRKVSKGTALAHDRRWSDGRRRGCLGGAAPGVDVRGPEEDKRDHRKSIPCPVTLLGRRQHPESSHSPAAVTFPAEDVDSPVHTETPRPRRRPQARSLRSPVPGQVLGAVRKSCQ